MNATLSRTEDAELVADVAAPEALETLPVQARYGYDQGYNWKRFDRMFDCGLLRVNGAPIAHGTD
jgi:hypothetical protein